MLLLKYFYHDLKRYNEKYVKKRIQLGFSLLIPIFKNKELRKDIVTNDS